MNIQASLAAYLFQELGENERLQTEEHLQSCDDCRRELQDLRLTVELLDQGLHRLPVADFIRAGQVLAVAAAAPQQRAAGWLLLRPLRRTSSAIVAVAAVLMLCGLLSFLLLHSLQDNAAYMTEVAMSDGPVAPSIASESCETAATATMAAVADAEAEEDMGWKLNVGGLAIDMKPESEAPARLEKMKAGDSLAIHNEPAAAPPAPPGWAATARPAEAQQSAQMPSDNAAVKREVRKNERRTLAYVADTVLDAAVAEEAVAVFAKDKADDEIGQRRRDRLPSAFEQTNGTASRMVAIHDEAVAFKETGAMSIHPAAAAAPEPMPEPLEGTTLMSARQRQTPITITLHDAAVQRRTDAAPRGLSSGTYDGQVVAGMLVTAEADAGGARNEPMPELEKAVMELAAAVKGNPRFIELLELIRIAIGF